MSTAGNWYFICSLACTVHSNNQHATDCHLVNEDPGFDAAKLRQKIIALEEAYKRTKANLMLERDNARRWAAGMLDIADMVGERVGLGKVEHDNFPSWLLEMRGWTRDNRESSKFGPE